MSKAPVGLRLLAESTLLEFAPAEVVALPVGMRRLVEDILRHDPPTPVELERAIDAVEDALAAARLVRADRATLETDDVLLHALPGFDTQGLQMTLQAVESLFQQLASRSLGAPIPATLLPPGRDFAAALLILRECMHHLGFTGVSVGPGPLRPNHPHSH